MKLVTYAATRRGPAKIGVVAADGSIIDLATAAKKARVKLSFAADDMISLIAAARPLRRPRLPLVGAEREAIEVIVRKALETRPEQYRSVA